MLLCVEPDDTERVLIDPAALDPTGLTTLDAWQPDKQGRQLAYQLSVGALRNQPCMSSMLNPESSSKDPSTAPATPHRMAARRRLVLLRPAPAT